MMARLEHIWTQIKRDCNWERDKDTAYGWMAAATAFAHHYQGTSVRHRLAVALPFADEHWLDARKNPTEFHGRFLTEAVVLATINNWANRQHSTRGLLKSSGEPLAVNFARIVADLLLVYHTYWCRYHAMTLRAGNGETEWKTMLLRFEKLPAVDRAAIFEEFVDVTLQEDRSGYLITKLVPYLPLPEDRRRLAIAACARNFDQDPVDRKIWDTIVWMTLDHTVDEAAKALGPVPNAAA